MKLIKVIKSKIDLDEFFRLQKEKCLKLSKQIKSLLRKNGFDNPVHKKDTKWIRIDTFGQRDKREAIIELLKNNFKTDAPKWDVDSLTIDGISIEVF